MSIREILIIDESQAARDMVASILQTLQANLTFARDGEEGFDLALNKNFDLIISDMMMSGISGVELCYKLRSTPKTKAVPVIILSIFDSEEKIEEGYQAGAEAYISKKSIRKILLKTVHQVLSKFNFQRGKRILLADDSDSIRNMVQNGLEKAGFLVCAVENGKLAYDIMQTESFDLLLSDIEMPVMDGFQLLDLVHNDPELSCVPVIIMSTHFERSYIKRIILQGAVSYLVKPFNIDQLVSQVERVLSDQFVLLRKEKERADLERTLILASITSLVSALEARDIYTRGHSEAVSTIAESMLNLYGATQKQRDDLAMAGRLHDIGKIGVRDNVLLKPGALTDEEFAHLKKHPTTGAEILKSIPSLYNIIPVVKYHHERFDGKGYPDGLKRTEIPFWARITSVADTYHALISDRPYRKGMAKDKAVTIVKDASGSQLCPDCVELFLKWYT